MRQTFLRTMVLALAWLALAPALTFGQTTGNIAGAVRDTSGAVLPGVMVEAASPALIEKVRTAVTDAQGLYQVTDLPPGTYSVTFMLAGFATVKRDGIALTVNFTATVNAELRVGAIEETITVSGQAPTVDTRNVEQAPVFTREVLDEIPTATGFAGRGQLIPGMVLGTGTSQDVGGNASESLGSMAFHGGHISDFQPFVDGMSVTNGVAKQSFGYNPNNGMMQETVIEVSSQGAENEFSGVVSNLVPKDGGNTFRGSFYGNDATRRWQSNNLTPSLISQGLVAVPRVAHFWDFNPSGGGPFLRDKVWFYTSYRYWGINQYAANAFYNDFPLSVFPPCTGANVPGCTPPGSQAITFIYHYSLPLRIAWQATPKNKFTFYGEHQYTVAAAQNAITSPEASLPQHYNPQYLIESTWSAPITNRLLFQAALGVAVNDPYRYHMPNSDDAGHGTTPNDISAITEQSTGFTYRANPSLSIGSGYGRYWSTNWTYKGSASYVTGTNNAKIGVNMSRMTSDLAEYVDNSLNYFFTGGRPSALQEFATGYNGIDYFQSGFDIGTFAQDQMTLKKLTVNMGVRLDHAHFRSEPSTAAAGPFAPARSIAGVENVPNYWDVNSRVGVSYDVFGNGKTAIKATLGRYVEAISSGTMTIAANPLSTQVLSVTRLWTDLNFPNDLTATGDVLPTCNLQNPLAQTNCPGGQSVGQISDLNFGQTARVTTSLDPSATQGFQNRGYNWETSFSIQRELLPGVSVNAGFFRRWYGNQRVQVNTALNASAYTPFCVTAPVNPNLPSGISGSQICGFYDENPANTTTTNELSIQSVNNVGSITEHYNGVDFTVNARLKRGVIVAGGFNTGRSTFNYCYYANLPNVANLLVLASGISFGPAQAYAAGTPNNGVLLGEGTPRAGAFCNVAPPFLTQGKAFVVYPLPWWGIQTSATFQTIPGNPIYAGTQITNGVTQTTLGRPLTAGNLVVDLVAPGQMYTPRLNQVDARLSKIIRAGSRLKITGNFDVYNLFNKNTPLAVNTRVGPNFLQPTTILFGRLAKIGVQVDF